MPDREMLQTSKQTQTLKLVKDPPHLDYSSGDLFFEI